MAFLDDITGGARSAKKAMADANAIRDLLLKLGFEMQMQKCKGLVEELQVFEALGYVVDLPKQRFRTPTARESNILAGCRELARQPVGGWVAARELARLKGLITSTFLSVGSATRIFTRAMDLVINARLTNGGRGLTRQELVASWESKVQVSEELLFEIRWWIDFLPLVKVREGREIAAMHVEGPIDAYLAVDASWSGWGGTCQAPFVEHAHAPAPNDVMLRNLEKMAAHSLAAAPEAPTDPRERAIRSARGGFSAFGSFSELEQEMSSTHREVLGAIALIESMGEVIRGCRVRLRLDSQCAVFLLGGLVLNPKQKDNFNEKPYGGSKRSTLQDLIVKLYVLCRDLDIELYVVWVPREANTLADWISHWSENLNYDYALRASEFTRIERLRSPFAIDRFASPYTVQTRGRRFNSFAACPGSEWVDALNIAWGDQGGEFWHPLYGLLDRVIAHIYANRCDGTLIAPRWRTAAWWTRLFPNGRRPAPEIAHVDRVGVCRCVLEYRDLRSQAEAERHLPKGLLFAFTFRFHEPG